MGNLASCTCTPRGKPSPLVTKVLLIDGSMLKFRAPIKVIHLLLDYPNHVICPLDSLKPGLHSLTRLLPDEKLQLGGLYLLLPFKAHMQQQSCITSKSQLKAQQNEQKKLLKERGREPSQAARGVKGQSARLVSMQKPKVGFAQGGETDVGFAELGNQLNIDNDCRDSKRITEKRFTRGDICEWSERKERQGLLRKPEIGSSKCSDLNRKCDAGLEHHKASRRSARSSDGELSDRRRGKDGHYCTGLNLRSSSKCDSVRRPLCDTPELQRAYRSLRLRRSTSWTPRLQPIHERH